MANIIALGTAQADSTDFIVVAGTPSTVHLTTADSALPSNTTFAVIQLKDANGQYMDVGFLSRTIPAQVIDGPGTFRVRRLATPVQVGVDRE